MTFPGGIADKLGNRYEAKWLVRQLLDVIAGKTQWVRFEGITPPFDGFEFAVRRGGITEWHQTKMNAPNGNWTIAALNREHVLTAFKNRFRTSVDDRCIFVSQDPARDFRDLVEKAGIASDVKELIAALPGDQKDKLDRLVQAWGVDNATAYAWLKRCNVRVLPESELDGIIESYADLYFVHNGSSIFSELREYAENRFNKTLTTEVVREEIRSAGAPVIKVWSLNPTLSGRLKTETDAYLQTYNPFGAGKSSIPRIQTDDLVDQIVKLDGPNLILLTGVAGSGKSGVVRGLIEKLRGLGLTHLAFRVDHHLGRDTPQEIGMALVGRNESPVSTLKGLEPERISVLIVDQLDAVSEVSGRTGAVKEAVLRMVNHARDFGAVRVVLVCRSFDLDSDPRLKALKEADGVEHIAVPQLGWNSEVAPFLADKGIAIDRLLPSQKELLCLPLNLAIFLEIDGDGQSFMSRNDLFKKLLERKERSIREDRSVSWTIFRPLTTLAQWMSDRQRLDAPEAVLDNFPGALDLLTSYGLIVRFRNRIGFFHESFFDYIYARGFVRGDRSIIDLLTSTEQHLFRRTQTRQILEALRQEDPGRYLHELETLFKAETVRYHIKVAVTQWLGSLPDPTEKEKDIILGLDTGVQQFPPLVRHAVLSLGWFYRLYKDGWIQAILNGKDEERRKSVLWRLSHVAGEHPAEVAELMDEWWNNDPERGKTLLDWFGYVKLQSPNQSLLALCRKVILSKPANLFSDSAQHRREMLLVNWAEKSPSEGSAILQTLLDVWFEMYPGRHPFEEDGLTDLHMHYLEGIAKKSPEAFIGATIGALKCTVDEINRREVEGKSDHTFRHRTSSGNRFGADNFLGLFVLAIRVVARDDPDTVREFLSEMDASKHEAFLHIHLEAVSVNGEAFAGHLLDLLGSKHLFRAGWMGADWRSFADAARAAYPYLSNDERHRVEDVILSHQPEIDLAIKVAHDIKEHGETDDPWWNRRGVISDLNRSGFEQLCILDSIGEGLLTDTGIQVLERFRRKFPGHKSPKPTGFEVHEVQTPIKREKAARMNDVQWLAAIAKYANDDWRQYGHDSIEGGARQLAGELQHAAKENPPRYVALMKHIPHQAHPAYIEHILWGIGESQAVENDVLKEAIIEAHTRPGRPYGIDIARLFEKRPEIAKDSYTFDILTWYMENGDANEDEVTSASQTTKEIVTVNDLMRHGESLRVSGKNGTRGRAAEALGAVLWQVPDFAEKAWEILARRIDVESLVSVRCDLVRALAPLFNCNRLRCAQLIERLIEAPLETSGHKARESYLLLSPLMTYQGIHLLPYLLYWVPDVGRRLVDRLLDSGDEKTRMMGAWHVFRRSFQDPSYIPIADALIEEGVAYRRLAADVASDAITHEEFRERAERQLVRFFNDEDKHVRREAGDVFRRMEENDLSRFSGLIQAYLASSAIQDDAFAFFHSMEKSTCSIHEYVICAAERIIADIDIDPASRRHIEGLYQLKDLLKREYAASENNPDLRRRILNVIDKMLERELYGIDEILKAHERE